MKLTKLPDAFLELQQEAHERRQRIIELGDEIHSKRAEQAQDVLWFFHNPKTWKSLGYESFKHFFFQEDIQQALGLNVNSQSAESKALGLLLVDAAVPEAAVFSAGRSKLEAAMPLLRPMAAAALNAPEPERERELKSTLLHAVNTYRDLKYREVTTLVQTQRPTPYRLTTNSGKLAVGELDEETGELDVLLVQTPDCDQPGAGRAMARLLKSRTLFTWDDEGIWTQIEPGVWELALRWARRGIPYKTKERTAEACKAERRS